jgi:hypothetical protein
MTSPKSSAQEQLESFITDAREEALGTAFGFAHFLNQSAVTEEGKFVALLLALTLDRPKAGEALRDYMCDAVEQYAQLEGDARQWGRGTFAKKPLRVALTSKTEAPSLSVPAGEPK